jgi:DNA-binding SARP family transcriptional activator
VRSTKDHEVLVRVLGAVELHVAGQPVQLSSLQRHLLAVLALRPGQPVGVDRLIFSLWGDDAPRSAPNRIQALVSDIRRRLAKVGVDELLIETVPPGYRLRTDIGALDAELFEQLVRGGRYDDALALWRGPAFDGVHALLDPALAAVVGRLEEARINATEDRFEARLALGADADLVPDLTALVEMNPLRERLRAQLMLALARAGRVSDALEVYRAGYAITTEELGTEPGEALQTLHKGILRGETGGLKAPLAPRTLPAMAMPFVGRKELLRDLDEAASGSSAMVITTLEGTGGVGKTALAVQWSHGIAESYPDGQLYLNLHGYSASASLRPIEALAKLLTALGISPAGIPADEEAAAALYRSTLSGKRVLVLLDNAASPDQVRPLLPSEPHCLAVITSRDRFTGLIASHGARRFYVDVMNPGEAVALFSEILGAARIANEPEAAAELAKACSHLPLALRIVAANLIDAPERRLSDVVADLHSEHGLGAMRVEDDPQMSVSVVIGQSYAKLDPAAQRVFTLLGMVPAADVTVAGAAALCELPYAEMEAILDRLVRVCLAQESGGRYSLHDVVRLFAREQVTGEPSLEPLFDHYLAQIDAAARLLYPQTLRLPVPARLENAAASFDKGEEALAWLEAERLNLVATVRHAAEKGPRSVAWAIADGLNGFFWIRRYMADWLLVGELGLEAAEATGDLRGQVVTHICLGQAKRAAGRYAEAGLDFDAAFDLASTLDWPEAQARAMSNRAIVFAELGMLPQAAAGLVEGLAIDRRIGRVAGVAVGLLNLGSLRMRMGEFRQAFEDVRASLKLYQEIGAPGGEAMATVNLAHICRELSRYEEAEQFFAAATAVTDRIDDRYGGAMARGCRALLYLDQHRYAEALEDVAIASAAARESADPKTEAQLLVVEAEIRQEMGEEGQAGELLTEARERFETLRDDFGLAEALLGQAMLAVSPDVARTAVDLAAARGYRLIHARAQLALAMACHASGDSAEARRHAAKALGGFRSVGNRLGEAKALALLADLVPTLDRELRGQATEILAALGLPTRK